MAVTISLDRIGVGIDTARYGHRVSFLRPDRQPAAKPITVMENHAGYQSLKDRLIQLREQNPNVIFNVRIDAAGQYAANLEQFLRGLDLPITLSIGEPKRNKDYQKAHFPKRTTDDTESQAMARFAVVEQPDATPAPTTPMILLREVVGRLQAQVKQTTQAVNRLHNLLARVFPELATLTDDIEAGWVLQLLTKYPTAERIAVARLTSLEKIPHLSSEQAQALHQAAGQSVASLRGPVAEALVGDLVTQLRHCQNAERSLRKLLTTTFAALPASPHVQVLTIPGIGQATAAAIVGKIVRHRPLRHCPTRSSAISASFPRRTARGSIGRAIPCPPARCTCRAKATIWCVATSGMPPASPSATTPPSAPCIAVSGPRANEATLPWATACASSSTWSSPSGRPIVPSTKSTTPGRIPQTTAVPTNPTPSSAAATDPANDKAGGHKRNKSAKTVVTPASSTVEAAPSAVKPAKPPGAVRPQVDFAFLRQQVSLEQVLAHLGLFDQLRGSGPQRRGPCPVHSHAADRERTFSVDLGKNAFRCLHADCGVQGNALDLWAAVHRLPMYDAALHLAETFGLPRNREEQRVTGTR